MDKLQPVCVIKRHQAKTLFTLFIHRLIPVGVKFTPFRCRDILFDYRGITMSYDYHYPGHIYTHIHKLIQPICQTCYTETF